MQSSLRRGKLGQGTKSRSRFEDPVRTGVGQRGGFAAPPPRRKEPGIFLGQNGESLAAKKIHILLELLSVAFGKIYVYQATSSGCVEGAIIQGTEMFIHQCELCTAIKLDSKSKANECYVPSSLRMHNEHSGDSEQAAQQL